MAAKKLRASRSVLRKNSNTRSVELGWSPILVVTKTVGPARVPHSAE